jgi:hypothetical protein
MLARGNQKLGERLIWGFGPPSGRPEVCLSLSAECRAPCCARQVERLRPGVRARLRGQPPPEPAAGLRAARRYVIRNRGISEARLHVGGDFSSVAYTRKWLGVMEQLPQVRVCSDTRPGARPRSGRLWSGGPRCPRAGPGIGPPGPRRPRLVDVARMPRRCRSTILADTSIGGVTAEGGPSPHARHRFAHRPRHLRNPSLPGSCPGQEAVVLTTVMQRLSRAWGITGQDRERSQSTKVADTFG